MDQYSGKWLRSPKNLLFVTAGKVARITLNRPHSRNALSNELLSELRDAFLEADDRTDINVILLDGAGKDFCAGYDMKSVYDQRAKEETEARPAGAVPYRQSYGTFDDDCWNIERYMSCTAVISDLHKPVVAKVHGNCLAGGTDLAFRCDLVVAADDARIGFPATRAQGSPPSHMWIYHCGPQWAKRMLLTGDQITGRDAAKIGLVLDAVPASELEDFAVSLAERIALVDADIAATQKRIVNVALEAMGMSFLQRLAIENDARSHLGTGPRRSRYKRDMAQQGIKEALKNRDEGFGDSLVRLRALAD
jgi:enoyl-CoA hydratase